ncbi:MAG: hypothetical protein QOJ12_2599, partial [Thermoleophilales bacterium]|nr:hypothetical protein [Thermoleophilales bacterium]
LAEHAQRTLVLTIPLDLGRPRAGKDVVTANAILRRLAPEHKAILVPLDDLRGTPYLLPDAVHPTSAGMVEIAERAATALEAAGVRVPAEVSVVGFDGIALGAHSRIALTTVAQPRDELTTRGLELLLDRIHGPPGTAPPRLVTLPPTLVVRGSTARPRS